MSTPDNILLRLQKELHTSPLRLTVDYSVVEDAIATIEAMGREIERLTVDLAACNRLRDWHRQEWGDKVGMSQYKLLLRERDATIELLKAEIVLCRSEDNVDVHPT
jgi:hypothetical protein